MDDHSVDCIVRFHDPERLNELNRCVFSLLGQSHRPLTVVLALQRFSEADVEATRKTLQPLFDLPGAPSLVLCNLEQPTPVDARTLLLNMGLGAARGRYVGFLDYDDVLYPEAYDLLIRRLEASAAAIAFGGVRVVEVDLYGQYVRVDRVLTNHFGSGDCLRDLFNQNFCPIHSFLIDRDKVGSADLIFDPALTWEEDYDLLLRLCAKYRSDFHLVHTQIGDYYFKRDGSNTSPGAQGLQSPAQILAYEHTVVMIEARRRTTRVSHEVQAEQGLASILTGMTIRDFLNTVPRRG